MRLDFQERSVVVTGAGGALGGAVTRLLLEQGAVCHLPSRSDLPPAGFGTTAAARVRVVRGVDLSIEERVRAFYAGLDGLWASIHCAGGFGMSPLAETSGEDFTAMFRLNTLSAFLCCREAVRAMRRGGGTGGRIVNIASRAALEPRTGAGMAAYTASKAAVAALTEALAEECAAEGIWLNSVAPSILDTEANRRAMPDADPTRWASVEDVANTIVFLASPENRSSRGGSLPVYGRT